MIIMEIIHVQLRQLKHCKSYINRSILFIYYYTVFYYIFRLNNIIGILVLMSITVCINCCVTKMLALFRFNMVAEA